MCKEPTLHGSGRKKNPAALRQIVFVGKKMDAFQLEAIISMIQDKTSDEVDTPTRR